MHWLRRRIVLASPWCTLWFHDHDLDLKRFIFCRSLTITADEFWRAMFPYEKR